MAKTPDAGYTGAMSRRRETPGTGTADEPPDEPPDAVDLAQRFLDLWQNQMAAMAADPELAEFMGRLFDMQGAAAAAAQGMPPWAAGWPSGGAMPGGGERRGEKGVGGGDGASETKPGARRGGAAGSAPAGAPSGGRDDDLVDLARRLAECEKRLVALESGPGARRGRARPATRKKKS